MSHIRGLYDLHFDVEPIRELRVHERHRHQQITPFHVIEPRIVILAFRFVAACLLDEPVAIMACDLGWSGKNPPNFQSFPCCCKTNETVFAPLEVGTSRMTTP